jgi:hypothetical protein
MESAFRLDLGSDLPERALTLAKLKILPFTVQVSIPLLLFAFYNTYRNLAVSVAPAHT